MASTMSNDMMMDTSSWGGNAVDQSQFDPYSLSPNMWRGGMQMSMDGDLSMPIDPSLFTSPLQTPLRQAFDQMQSSMGLSFDTSHEVMQESPINMEEAYLLGSAPSGMNSWIPPNGHFSFTGSPYQPTDGSMGPNITTHTIHTGPNISINMNPASAIMEHRHGRQLRPRRQEPPTISPRSLQFPILTDDDYSTTDYSGCSSPNFNDGQDWNANNEANSSYLFNTNVPPSPESMAGSVYGCRDSTSPRMRTRSHGRRLKPDIGEDDEVTFNRTNPNDSPERLEENRILMEAREKNTPYKAICASLGNKYTESTLRGRWRTLSKKRQDRVRKPRWMPHDVKLLKEEVEKTHPPNGNTASTAVKWKQVTENIKQKGASYKFGVTTAKKKYLEVLEKGLDRVMKACNEDIKTAKK